MWLLRCLRTHEGCWGWGLAPCGRRAVSRRHGARLAAQSADQDPGTTAVTPPCSAHFEEQLSAAPPAAWTKTLGGMDRKNMRLA